MTIEYKQGAARLEGFSETLNKRDLVEVIRQQDERIDELEGAAQWWGGAVKFATLIQDSKELSAKLDLDATRRDVKALKRQTICSYRAVHLTRCQHCGWDRDAARDGDGHLFCDVDREG